MWRERVQLVALGVLLTGVGALLLGGAVAAGQASPTAGGLVIADEFTEAEMSLGTPYAGPASSIKITVVDDPTAHGQRALRIDSVTKDWNGVPISAAGDKEFDWSDYRALSMWVYGTNSGVGFFVELNDKGEEHFRSPLIVDDFIGWKQIVIPFEEFLSRDDWQPDTADMDLEITWPIRDFQPFTGASGEGYILIDLIEVIP
ncbi:MAG: carbohydrate binding domain-containing protein [Bacteroidota bacterium]